MKTACRRFGIYVKITVISIKSIISSRRLVLLIGFLACMNARVVFQIYGFSKGQSTDAALVVFFTAVQLFMGPQT